jgi:uncharacterized Zn ribbon protein
MTDSRGTSSARIEGELVEPVDHEKDQNRHDGSELHQDQQQLAVVSIDQHAAEGAEQQTRTGAAQTQDAEGHGRTGDLVGDPKQRHFLNEMTERTQQVGGPEERVIAIAQRVKDANGGGLLVLSALRILGFGSTARKGAKFEITRIQTTKHMYDSKIGETPDLNL